MLFTRLDAIRAPTGGLTPNDETLRPKLASLDSRLLYLTYGPDVLTHCPFCLSDEPLTYLYYALPSLLLPHILHLLALGLATSTLIAADTNTNTNTNHRAGPKFRTVAVSLGLAAAATECYLFGSYDWKANARVPRPEDYVHFYTRMRLVRGLLLAITDAVLAGALYLAGTNRMFLSPPSPAERTETALRVLEQAKGKLSAVGIVRNAVVRDEALRRRTEGYWREEGRVMGEVMAERDVVDGVRGALEQRVQVGRVEEEARRFADGITVWNFREGEAGMGA